jgi:hypothetical protein
VRQVAEQQGGQLENTTRHFGNLLFPPTITTSSARDVTREAQGVAPLETIPADDESFNGRTRKQLEGGGQHLTMSHGSKNTRKPFFSLPPFSSSSECGAKNAAGPFG